MSAAWREASKVLGIDVTAPYYLESEDGPLRCTALIHGFGRGGGIVAICHGSAPMERLKQIRGPANQAGFGVSQLYEEFYAKFDRELFEETLNEWGWLGDEADAPAWYVGPDPPDPLP